MAIVVAKGGIVGGVEMSWERREAGRYGLGEAGKQEAGEAGEAGGRRDRQAEFWLN